MLMACVAIVAVSAQDNMFSKGDKVLNATVGLGSSIYGAGFKTGIPPVGVSFEYGVKDELFNEKSSLGIGGIVGYSSATTSTGFAMSYSSIIVGVRGIVHYALVDNLDTYGGLMLGYNAASVKITGGNSTPAGGVAYGGFVGARYYFSPKFAAMAELGYGIALLNLGVSIKL